MSALAAALAAALLALEGASPGLPARMGRGHAHNDYEHERPLLDALEHGYASVEADVWWRDGELRVAHRPFGFKGSLAELYLRPLQARVDRLGSVRGDGRPFLLWIDLKESSRELEQALRAALAGYPMLAPCDGTGRAPVVAILTGAEGAKRRLVEGSRPVPACRDSNRFSTRDPDGEPAWTWYALRWGDHVRWDGRGAMPATEREALRRLVEAVHAKGRRIRLYHAPEREAVWREALAAGVDLIGTDRLPELRGFLERDAARVATAAGGGPAAAARFSFR